MPEAVSASLISAAQQAFTSGLNTAGIVSAVVAALAALIAATPHPTYGRSHLRIGAHRGIRAVIRTGDPTPDAQL